MNMNMQRVSSVRVNANIIITEKDVFSHLVTSVGQRKNSESPWGIESHTFEFRAPMLAPCRQIRSIIILAKNRANSRCAVVGFCKHSYCWKYRHSKWFVINRNGLIVFWRTVFFISRDYKIQESTNGQVAFGEMKYSNKKCFLQFRNCAATIVELIQ